MNQNKYANEEEARSNIQILRTFQMKIPIELHNAKYQDDDDDRKRNLFTKRTEYVKPTVVTSQSLKDSFQLIPVS